MLSKIDHGGMDIIKMILKVTQMPLQYPTEESCSPVSFSFWYSLQDEYESMTMELQQNWGPLIHHLFFELIQGILILLSICVNTLVGLVKLFIDGSESTRYAKIRKF